MCFGCSKELSHRDINIWSELPNEQCTGAWAIYSKVDLVFVHKTKNDYFSLSTNY